MSIKHNYNEKVTSDTPDGLKDKIDKLTVMMNKLATRDNGMNRQFKLQTYQNIRREESRNFYDTCNYDRGMIKIGTDQIVEAGELNLVDKVEVYQGMNKFTEKQILKAM